MSIEITKLEIQDWEAYRDLRLKALRDDPSAFSDSLEEGTSRAADYWKGHLDVNEEVSISLFAKKNNKLVGMGAAIFNNRRKMHHVAELAGIYVDKNERGNGIGSLLMSSLLDNIQKKDYIKKIKLSVNTTQKPAIGLYEKFGFKPVGVAKKELFMDDMYFDLLLMERLL